MSEPKFPSSATPGRRVHDRLAAEIEERVQATQAGRNREVVEAKWEELKLTPEQRREKAYQKRWASVRVGKGVSHIPLTREQTRDVLDRLGMDRLPPDGECLLVHGAKLKVSRSGEQCSLGGYHHNGDDLAEVVERIRTKQTILPDA